MSKRPSEFEVQKSIVDALQLAGFIVFHTTAYRQKGSSGVSRGVPDLLVAHELIPCTYFGLEVKKPGKIQYSSREQSEAHLTNRFVIAQGALEAVEKARIWMGIHIPGGTLSSVYLRVFQKIDAVIDALKPVTVNSGKSAEGCIYECTSMVEVRV